jgi:hypothetical protein
MHLDAIEGATIDACERQDWAGATSAPDFDKIRGRIGRSQQMSRVIKMSTPKRKPASLPKTAR